MVKSNFIINHETSEYMYIIDVGHRTHKTVTNDAENVVKHLFDNFDLGNRRLIYSDSDGKDDELVHDGKGTFKGYKAGHDGINLYKT